jgi:nonsense-mediated mRNA decay protein 3
VDVCVVCGKRKAVIGPFCEVCYVPKVRVEKNIEVERCKVCGRFKVFGEWTSRIRRLKEFLAKRVKGGDVAYVEVDLKNQKFIVGIKGANVEKEYSFNLRFKDTTCPVCSRIAGGYYEAVIQLRGDRRKVEEFLGFLMKNLQSRTPIVRVEPLKEWIDVYVFSSKEALNFVKELGMSYKLSRKLHGVKQGKRIYRLTIALRFE